MINEAYCSYEVSKLLKEKGFNESVRTFYTSDGKFEYCAFELNHNLDIGSGFTSAPTHQIAMAWLREEKNIVIEINMDGYMTTDDGKLKKWYSYTIWTFIQHLGETGLVDSRFDDRAYWQENVKVGQTYEQAVEAALLYALKNLI